MEDEEADDEEEEEEIDDVDNSGGLGNSQVDLLAEKDLRELKGWEELDR